MSDDEINELVRRGEWYKVRPDLRPIKIRNIVTGNEMPWDPIFTLHDDLELIYSSGKSSSSNSSEAT